MSKGGWLTSRQVGEILGVSHKNIKQVSGFKRIQRIKGGPYGGYLYHRGDVEAVAAYRASGQAWKDSYANRQKNNRKRPSKRKVGKRGKSGKKQLKLGNGRSVSVGELAENRAAIEVQELAVLAGELEPLVLPSSVRVLK